MSARAVISWLLTLHIVLLPLRFPPSAQAQPRTAAPAAPPAVFLLPEVPLPPRLALRKAVLETDFQEIRDESKGRDWWLGSLLLISATLVGFGSAYPRQVGPLLLPIGALGLVRGTIAVSLLDDPRIAAEHYLRLPQWNAEQVRERIRFGERALAEQARQQRRARILDGALSCVLATSYVPLAYLISRRQDPDYRFRDDNFNFALLALSVVNFGSALVAALGETPTEQRNRSYRALVAQQEAESPGELERLKDSLSLRLLGSKQRLELSASVTF